jgi:hypothetical protein
MGARKEMKMGKNFAKKKKKRKKEKKKKEREWKGNFIAIWPWGSR